MFQLARRIWRDLRTAGFDDAERRAVRDTHAMWEQVTRFYRAGGRIERVAAEFSGATGQPGLIRFFCPPSPQRCAHANFGALAHELGHALQCPEQWRPVTAFSDAESYAHAREMGEAQAWLNQYRLCRVKQGGAVEDSHVQMIENDQDFGTMPVDLFARIAQREAEGWPEARIRGELAVLNANMFPCGMGEGNHKTYGQCNRWDWLNAHRDRLPALDAFLTRLGRAPTAADQKVLTKFNLLTDQTLMGEPPDEAALMVVAGALSPLGRECALPALFDVACRALPDAAPGVSRAYSLA